MIEYLTPTFFTIQLFLLSILFVFVSIFGNSDSESSICLLFSVSGSASSFSLQITTKMFEIGFDSQYLMKIEIAGLVNKSFYKKFYSYKRVSALRHLRGMNTYSRYTYT